MFGITDLSNVKNSLSHLPRTTAIKVTWLLKAARLCFWFARVGGSYDGVMMRMVGRIIHVAERSAVRRDHL
jgi:hypothetical protein